MSEFKTHIELEVTVMGDYQPGEAQTHNYPGCAESATVGAVMLKTSDFRGNDIEADILDFLPADLVRGLEEEILMEEYQKDEREENSREAVAILNRTFRDAMAQAFRRHNIQLVQGETP